MLLKETRSLFFSKKGQSISLSMNQIAKWIILALILFGIIMYIINVQGRTDEAIGVLPGLFGGR